MRLTAEELDAKLLRASRRNLRQRMPGRRRRQRGPGPKQKRLGPAIRKARQAAKLTQAQLGEKLGIQGRTVHRWETNQAAPTPRHERAMVRAIAAGSPAAAEALQAALDAARGKVAEVVAPAVPVAPQTATTRADASNALKLAVFGFAEDLELPPQRLRSPLARLFERLRAANLTLDASLQELESWIAELGN